jgi:hypothetical protein
MKTLIYLFAILLFVTNFSCKKQEKCCTAAAPGLLYQVIDKNGENILNSHSDSVTLTYNNSQFYDRVFELITNSTGLTLIDGKMVQLNAGIGTPNPIHTFELSYNGQNLGSIYLDSVKQHSNWQEAKVFTFNNVPVKLDSTSGAHIYFIQLTQ